MANPVAVYRGASVSVRQAGVPVVAIYGRNLGGRITNPASPADQAIFALVPVIINGPSINHGPLNTFSPNTLALNSSRKSQSQYRTFQQVPTTEPLYIDLVGPAALDVSETTFMLWPGQSFTVPVGQANDVWVNAATAGHRFAAVVFQPPTQYPPTPIPSTFPPPGPTSKTTTIKSYLYQEYSDDDDLQTFVDAYNDMTQDYVDTFNDLNLPIYTGEIISGTLLDWVATGIYGLPRPSLYTGQQRVIGPINTYAYNSFLLNARKELTPYQPLVTTDDIYKRILTWHYFKGDGKVFNIRWLKRRVLRFLAGPNGTNADTAATYAISVTISAGGAVNIQVPASPIATILQEAVAAGVLELPFQNTFTVTLI